MERAEGLLGGKFHRQNDGTIDKTEVACSICQIEFSYHRSSYSLSYHLNGHSLYDGERARKIQLLEQAATFALTGDYWTSVSNDNYLGVTAHFIDNVWKLRYFSLEVKKKKTDKQTFNRDEFQNVRLISSFFLSID